MAYTLYVASPSHALPMQTEEKANTLTLWHLPLRQVLLVLAKYHYYKTLLENEMVNHTQQFALYITAFLSSLMRSLYLSFLHRGAALKYFLYIHHKLFPLINYYIMYNISLDCILLLLLQRVDSLVVLSLGCKVKPRGRGAQRNGKKKGVI